MTDLYTRKSQIEANLKNSHENLARMEDRITHLTENFPCSKTHEVDHILGVENELWLAKQRKKWHLRDIIVLESQAREIKREEYEALFAAGPWC